MKYIYLILALILCSCTKEISYTGDEAKQQLVLFGFLQEGQPIKIQLSHSQFALASKTDNQYVKDAEVQISINGNAYTTIQHDKDGMYTNAYVLKVGDLIKIKAKHPNYASIESQVIVSQKSTYKAEVVELGVDYVILDVEIDDAKEKNYYSLTGSVSFSIDYKNGQNQKVDILGYTSVDPLLQKKGTVNVLNDKTQDKLVNYFADDTFNNTKRKLRIKFLCNDYAYNKEEITKCKVEKIQIDVSTLSYSYYAYKLSIDQYIKNINDYFAEKTQIYTNVDNGLGVFAIRTPHIITVNY